MIYSLLTVHRTNPDGTVDGGWLQDHSGTRLSAKARAEKTSVRNSGMDIAVVASVGWCGPGDLFYNQTRVA
jgi:hypothetical protein